MLRITHADNQLSNALGDLVAGFAMWQLWSTLGWNDIRQRYRRSRLGPFWLTLSMGVMIGTIGFVYAELFNQPMANYLPFLALGLIVWGLYSGIVNEACFVFIGSEGIIRQLRVPYSVHVFRMLWRNLIVFAHNIVIYFVVIVVFHIAPNANLLLVIPALFIIFLNGLWMAILLGALSARFRDFQPIVVNVMQIFFYVTPIVWKPEQLSSRPEIMEFNPLYYYVELLRAPLLGAMPPLSTWALVLAFTVVGLLVAILFLARFRGRIAYWL